MKKMLNIESTINDFKNAIINGNINDARIFLDTKLIDINMENGWPIRESIKQWNIQMVAMLLSYGCSTKHIYDNNITGIDSSYVSIIIHNARELNFN
ncbi:putative orfan [Tupanvirus soda lake]|uniref:Orfan n=2 Tax=Tupanvirus TaxID=2094720 RepID=A0AC62AAE2_9VIRU|nr:putative orfan [Tupanvirus soda lake]QKU34746.1 putative orfan [Tupanvirus soda lake]